MEETAKEDVVWRTAREVMEYINDDHFSKLKSVLKPLSKEIRREVANYKSNGHAPLFRACLQGKIHFVNFLLKECDADIEQKSIYEVEEDKSKHEVTPLWCAAVGNKLDIVKTLIAHGADLNSTSDTNSTPVRSACYMTNSEVVHCLVENGADINKPNISGGTCLINAVQSCSLCDFLIKKGAHVNAQDNSGNLALHYAIREGRPETVKLLVKNNADYTHKNDFGDSALQTAALKGFGNIVEYLVDNTKQSLVDVIHAYELLGANYVDEKHDFLAALEIWKKSMALRYLDPNKPMLKTLPAAKKKVYQYAVEPQTLEGLLAITNFDNFKMQSLLIRERILGTNHKDMTFGLMYRGAVYADSLEYQRCVDLWKYSLYLRHNKGNPLSHESVFTSQALIKLFWEMKTELDSGLTTEELAASDVIEVLNILSDEITGGMSNTTCQPFERCMSEDFHNLLCLTLHVIHLLCIMQRNNKLNSEHRRKVKSICSRLLKMDPRGNNNCSLLHLAMDSRTTTIYEEQYSQMPASVVVEFLLENGACVNSVDNTRNTPFLTGLMYNVHSDLHGISDCLKLLLRYDAHIDMCNIYGDSVYDYYSGTFLENFKLDYLSLKCLAARVIMKFKINFVNDVPSSLIPFIRMHGKEK